MPKSCAAVVRYFSRFPWRAKSCSSQSSIVAGSPDGGPPPVVTASTLIAYIFYTISPETEQKFGTSWLGLTIPFPLYGIFRYLYLVHRREGGGSPSDLLLNDRPLLACVTLWVVAVVLIVYHPFVP